MFDALHIDNGGIPLCGSASFDRDMLTPEDLFVILYEQPRCWECGPIIGIETINLDAS